MACSFNALAGDPPAPELLWRSKLNYSFAAPPAAADINLDGSFEIVVLSADNHVSLLSPSSQKTLWETKLTAKGQFSYAPAIGNFLGRGGLEIALVSSEGHLTLLEGGTGAVSLEGELGSGVAQAPTVYPIRPEDLGGEEFRDGLAVVSSGGTVFGFILHAGVALQPSFQFDLVGIVNHPVMVVHTGYEKPEPHLGVVTSEGTVHVLSAYPGSKDKISYQLDRGINNTWPAAGDVNGDGLDDLLIADDAGFLHALTVHGATVSRIWEKSSIDSKPSQNIALIDVNGDGRDDILVPRETRQFILINGASGKRDIWTGDSYFNHDADVKAPPAIFYGADKKAYAVLSDEAADHETVCVLDLKARTLKNDAQTQPVRIDTGGYSQTTPVVGPLSGGTEAEVFVMGWRTGAGYLAGLGMEANRSAPLWLGDHGGPRKTSNLSIAGQDYLNRQREALLKKVEDNVAKARGLYQEGRWKDAIGALEAALAANPGNAEAQKLLHSAKLRKNLIWIILALLAAIPALGFGGWQGTRALARLSRIKQSQAALAKGDKQRAAKLMLGIYKATRAPSPAAIKQLADLFIELKKYEPDTLEIFSKARDLNPKDGRYLHALAMVCFTGNRQDADAVKIYEEMHENEAAFGDPPGRWAFMLGQAHLKLGHDDKAMKCLKEALKQRYEEALTTTYLGDLYVRMNITRPEILPVLTPLLPERENDKIFLLVYCKAAQEGRNFDDAAQRAARALLDLDPTVPEAHVILASVLLQSGQVKDSLHHAEAILQRDPNDSVGLRLLGACYAAENRLDETAMEIFQKALAANPEAQEILLAVSKAYIQLGREDDEAQEIYRRSLAGNPNDGTILLKVAEIARKMSDDTMTIETVERLLKLGHHSRLLILQLADAYCRKNVTDDKAEPIYREALLFQPDHATVATQLATIYARHFKVDAEAMAVYEIVYNRDPKRRDVARALAAAYHKAEMADRTLAVTQRLLADDPNDNDMKKLHAHASVALDNMDSAIQGYEQVLERNPEDMESTCQLALLYGKKRQADPKALKIYQRAARAQKDSLDIHAALARAWAKQGNWEQVVATVKHLLSHAPKQISSAINVMEELVDGAPKAVELRWFLVDTLTYDQRLRDAERHLIEILNIAPDDKKRALASFERILDKNNKDATAHQYRGRLLKELGRASEARQALELAHRYRPADENIARDLMDLYEKILEKSDSPDVRFQLGRLAMVTGKYDLAISCFQRTDKDSRWEKGSVKSLARCFMSKGMLDLALQELRRIQMDDEVKEILYELGQRYEAVNDVRGAREVYKAIFAVDITYQDVKGKLESLESRQQDMVTAERTAIINALSDQAKARYELIEELGRGAMGIVYKARDNELDEVVALKILPETLGANSEALRRFRQEARNARHLSHPNIVRIHDIGEEMGRKYISMEFVNGGDLKQRLVETKRKLPFNETLELAKQICAAMIAAHDAGIVHRDIKPANIMITKDRRVKITDFGIAKAMEEDPRPSQEATRVGSIVGTPLYMSPEQVQGTPVDYRSDIYSMGIMFYEMATGYPPFTEGDLAYHHVFSQPKPMVGVNPDFARIVMKCLGKKGDERWQSVREMAEALSKIQI